MYQSIKYFVLVVLFILMTWSDNVLNAQLLPPDINCSQVDINGESSIIWSPLNDPNGEFVAYHIFASVSGGPFNEIALINDISTSTFVDNINDAALDEICYYIVVEYNTGAGNLMSDPGLIHCNTFLTATASSSPLGFVDVDWTGDASGTFNLIWDDINTSWNNSALVTDGSGHYSVEVTTCNALMSFVVSTQLGTCLNVSNVAEGFFNDQTPPAVPVVTSVSVSNGNPLISWSPSASTDTEGYILYRCSGGSVAIAETLFVPTTSYIDVNVNSAAQSGCYLLAAFDGCPNGNPPSPNTSVTGSTCNCAVLLSPVNQIPCSDQIHLQWTAYQGWENGVASYTIFHAEANGTFTQLGVVNGNTTQWSANLNGFVDLNHSFYVLATANDGYFAVSNVQTITLNYPVPPANNYLSGVSVELDNSITVTFQTTTTPTSHRYELQRFDDFLQTWNFIEEKTNSVTPVVFHVNDLDPDYFRYKFRVLVFNQCNDTVFVSNTARNVLLEGLKEDGKYENMLQWKPYETWSEGIGQYVLYRKAGEFGFYEEIANPSTNRLSYNDFIDSLYQSDGYASYRLEMISNPSVNFDTTFSVFSNEVVLIHEPKFFVPNAFMIGGVNNIFMPVISYSPLDKYEMYVYSKWGDVLFESHDYHQGWTGITEDGKLIPQGVYVYYIRYTMGGGQPIEARGLVTLLHKGE
jgi:hypothetical protein